MTEFIIAPFPPGSAPGVPAPASPLTTLAAAIAYLEAFSIMHASELSYEVDVEHPTCADALMFTPVGVQQYTIQPADFRLK